MRSNILILFLLVIMSVKAQHANEKAVHQVMDSWHEAAAKADFQGYFGLMGEESTFIGTDAMENWQRDAFEAFSKPYFDQGKAWAFEAIERNIYFSASGTIAWFDELLNTWMGTCRGSGVLEKIQDSWKIKHYVLSITIPNEEVEPVITLKKQKDSLIRKQKKRNW